MIFDNINNNNNHNSKKRFRLGWWYDKEENDDQRIANNLIFSLLRNPKRCLLICISSLFKDQVFSFNQQKSYIQISSSSIERNVFELIYGDRSTPI